jgi:hypothetical protein
MGTNEISVRGVLRKVMSCTEKKKKKKKKMVL